MEQTPNYALSQWDEQDRILREDFNANNAKVEQALAAQAATLAQYTAALAGCGNCKIVYGSYTGNGKYGSANPNRLTFDHKPVLVFVQEKNYVSNTDDFHLRMVRDSAWANGIPDNYYFGQTVSWGDKSVSWYSAVTNNGDTQFNKSSTVYIYVALLAADE